ncbi:MAG: aquaporin [Actinobacteria bacterium]|uniref:Unannotated protein n=1 Tax=freshwater metagenome TaxID=449393 RepID=A0A6J5ZY59_9ZZZZ|nr:aquaporin [Actinomycetota bacterium]
MDIPVSKRLAAECLGTFGFFLTAFMGIVTLATQGVTAIQSLGIAAGFGFGLAAMIFAFGHVSGGHFNPAVTLGLAAARKHPPSEILPYWAAQLVGGLIASLLILVLWTQEIVSKTVNVPGIGVSDSTAFIIEAIFTMLFVLVIATVATDERAPWKGVFAPFAIGLFIFTAGTVAGPISGFSFNPARSLAPAIAAGDFSHIWIYLLAPLLGGVVGGLIHLYFADDKSAARSEEFEDLDRETATN